MISIHAFFEISLTAFQPKSHCASSDTGGFGNRPDRSRRCGGSQRTLESIRLPDVANEAATCPAAPTDPALRARSPDASTARASGSAQAG
eukprot:CAMPEP_0179409732 /NCGR_PEP_ID=MMETSP0799-20121207/2873_1 /TAXON_ID=46947 /ORGANISM="Geminigera cryophila, Strain CCMP2564" /LENGTH=89 /DNA_ID=CAMNT_0021181459 /DNA_START=373 /DNA_END=642 /DNA_ORIENTATION=+